MKRFFILLPACLIMLQLEAQKLIDAKATRQTKALYANLKRISGQGIMFGHQDDDAYGVGWNEEEGRSDVKSVTGSYPAVHGFDLGHIEVGKSENLDRVKFDNMRRWIIAAYKRGGVTTISWHGNNPVSKGNTWDKTPAVKEILPGGTQHTVFLGQLDLLATFLESCKAGGEPVPMIFRPYHEHNGDWFWWGKGNCTEEEYKQLWQFTVRYLKDTRKLHHLIYAFSPDRSRWNLEAGESGYLYGYPGDDYVDVLGIDNYADVRESESRTTEQRLADLSESLSIVSRLAQRRNKVAVFSETGEEGVKTDDWFTKTLLNPLKANPEIRVAYVMVWRNAHDKPGHFYASYPGHSSADDFRKFYADPYVLFESEIQNMYKRGKPLTK